MEVQLTYKWNVYKVFKNGRRAKSLFCQIEAIDKSKAKEKFLNEHLLGSRAKYEKYTWSFLRSDLSQERFYEKNLEEEKKEKDKRIRYLTKLALEVGSLPNNITFVLLYSKNTDWNWQWTACEPATMRYLKTLSPNFKSGKKAEEWLTTQVKKNG
jgi:hypothetical protein|tara:strand:+ start:51 stop:515 length:465 start_codon:yes stop_codon:yes gene_type:complete